MFKNQRQFCKWSLKYNTLPSKVRVELEKEFIKRASQNCIAQGLKQDEFVITRIEVADIPFSFVVSFL